MAQVVKHAKVSGVPDGSDTSQVQPSDWNADHAIIGQVDYSEISGKPATFPPTLPIAQSGVTNLVADLALKAPLASPALTGTPTAPTAAPGTNTTQLATTAFVTAGDALQVTKAGDVMTGGLTITGGNMAVQRTDTTAYVMASSTVAPAYLYLDAPVGMERAVRFRSGTSERWRMRIITDETGANAGGDFDLYAFSDAAANLGSRFSIRRSDGAVMIGSASGGYKGTNTLNVAGAIYQNNVGIATDTELATKANLASPALTGTPTAPTAAAGTNTTQIATTAYVRANDDPAKLNLTGGTITGSLTLSQGSNLYINNTAPIVAFTDTDTGATSNVTGSSSANHMAFNCDTGGGGPPNPSSRMYFAVRSVNQMSLGLGLVLGAPTGSDKGAGTLNAAVGVYDNNVLLTCMALTEQFKRTGKFDDDDLAEWDAKVPPLVEEDRIEKRPVYEEVEVTKPVKENGKYRMKKVREKRPKIVEHEVLNDAGEVVARVQEQATEEYVIPGYVIPRQHHTARVFKDMIDNGFKPGDPASFIAKMREDGAMPGMPSAKEWVHNEISSGEMISRLWLSLETMGLAFEGLLARVTQDEGA